MRDPFADSRAKLNRGKAQFKRLHAETMQAGEADPVESDIAFDLERPWPSALAAGRPTRVATIYVTRAPKIPRELGLLVGETLHNFRSSLDHLAWSLVKHAGQRKLTAPQARDIQFPMARSRTSFRNQWTRRLRGVPHEPFRAILDDFQPYRRTPTGRAMRTLRNLSDRDKHRLLVPIAAFPYQGDIKFEVKPPWALLDAKRTIPLHRPVHVGMKIAAILLVSTGQTTIDVEGDFVTYPELPGRLPLEGAFNDIAAACSACIERVSAAFNA